VSGSDRADTNLAVVRAFLDEFHFSGKPDIASIMAFFAPGGTYQPLVPSTPASVIGPDFEAALERQFATYHECRCELHAVAAQGPYVFTERTDHVTLHAGDRKVASRVCAVFELDDAGLIVSWREYWDTGDVMRQMGFTAEQLAAAM
jgi:limonene-1,2-epoxide hydrolase